MKTVVTALFASDGRHLGKSFNKVDGELSTEQYPHVLKFRSIHPVVRTLEDLLDAIKLAADNGGCLLKGLCHKKLEDESRAGSTDPQDSTQWVCLDVDGLKGVESIEEFLGLLPKPFQQTSYIAQYSSSMGVVPNKGLSAHVFMLIKETNAVTLKHWLQRMNFEVQVLRDELQLARSGVALKYKLDISTCQNDKLIYVAPARLGRGVKNTFKEERIQLIKKRYATLNYDFSTEVDPRKTNREAQKALDALRKEEGLPKQQFRTSHVGEYEVVKGVKDNIVITEGPKFARGFAYFNINGGDSWGYFCSLNQNPEVLHNFKGEPLLLLSEIAPAAYARVVKEAENSACSAVSDGETDTRSVSRTRRKDSRSGGEALSEGDEQAQEGYDVIVGINDQTSGYFGLKYGPATGTFRFTDIGTVVQVKDFCAQHGVIRPDHLDRWTIEYDFTNPDYKVDPDLLRINLYTPSPYFSVPSYKSVPKTIGKILKHVVGDDLEAYDRLLNWLACVMQHRRLIGTAWLLSGTQGTGKGVLFNEIMTPILGEEYSQRTALSSLEKEFNSFMEHSLLVFVDEIKMSDLARGSVALSNIKQLVTEKRIALRKMRTDQYMVHNNANFIFASNHRDSMEIDPNDRRFLVAPRQESALRTVVPDSEIAKRVPAELSKFAGYLRTRTADLDYAREMFFSSERQRLQDLTRDSADAVVDALRAGSIKFFIENAPEKEQPGQVSLETGIDDPPSYAEFINHITKDIGYPVNIPRDMLMVVFYHINRNTFRTPHKFTKFLGKRGLEVKQVRVGDDKMRGIADLVFQADNETMKEIRQWLSKKGKHLKAVRSNTSGGSKSAKS